MRSSCSPKVSFKELNLAGQSQLHQLPLEMLFWIFSRCCSWFGIKAALTGHLQQQPASLFCVQWSLGGITHLLSAARSFQLCWRSSSCVHFLTHSRKGQAQLGWVSLPKVHQGKFTKAVFLPNLARRGLKSTSKVLKIICSLPLLDPKDGVCLQLRDVQAKVRLNHQQLENRRCFCCSLGGWAPCTAPTQFAHVCPTPLLSSPVFVAPVLRCACT